jgi:hypothetical protein
MKRRALRKRYGRSSPGLPTEHDLNFMVKELDGIHRAIAYAKKFASKDGPLASWYHDAHQRLTHRAGART